jgi:hypothetical protein
VLQRQQALNQPRAALINEQLVFTQFTEVTQLVPMQSRTPAQPSMFAGSIPPLRCLRFLLWKPSLAQVIDSQALALQKLFFTFLTPYDVGCRRGYATISRMKTKNLNSRSGLISSNPTSRFTPHTSRITPPLFSWSPYKSPKSGPPGATPIQSSTVHSKPVQSNPTKNEGGVI